MQREKDYELRNCALYPADFVEVPDWVNGTADEQPPCSHTRCPYHAECRFRSPARYDDVVTLRTKLTRIGPVKLEHDYELLREGRVLATGHTVLGCVDAEGQAQRIPDEILNSIQAQE